MENTTNLQKTYCSPEEREKYLHKWKESGLSKVAFCRENGLKYYTFISWYYEKKKNRIKGKKATTNSRFSEVKLPATVHESSFAEVRFQNGCSLHLFQSVTPEYLRSLLFQ